MQKVTNTVQNVTNIVQKVTNTVQKVTSIRQIVTSIRQNHASKLMNSRKKLLKNKFVKKLKPIPKFIIHCAVTHEFSKRKNIDDYFQSNVISLKNLIDYLS